MGAHVLTFNEVVELCQRLDAEHTNRFENKHRHTTLYIKATGICVRVSHHDNGVITGVVVDLFPDDDFRLEIRSLHHIIDDKLRKQKCIVDEILHIPF